MRRAPLNRKERASEWAISITFILALLSVVLSFSLATTWVVEAFGVWATGQIDDIRECFGRYDPPGSVSLYISYTDQLGYPHTVQSRCETDAQAFQLGQGVNVRYLPAAPWDILVPQDIGRNDGLTLLVVLIVDAVLIPLLIVFIRIHQRNLRLWTEAWVMQRMLSPARASQRRPRTNPALTRALRVRQGRSSRRIR